MDNLWIAKVGGCDVIPDFDNPEQVWVKNSKGLREGPYTAATLVERLPSLCKPKNLWKWAMIVNHLMYSGVFSPLLSDEEICEYRKESGFDAKRLEPIRPPHCEEGKFIFFATAYLLRDEPYEITGPFPPTSNEEYAAKPL
ncbi:MAG: hypothetical protein LBS68_01170 [Puniceicoccales bacterium]|jgi:hypothetical protein|nr:hypothetical protein [Puniceicoccales bacterium]